MSAQPEPGSGRQGWGLAGSSQSLGAGIAGGLPELLLEFKARLPVGFKQLLEAGVEVVILLLQVVQTGVDLVQHGVDGSIFWEEGRRESRSHISSELTGTLLSTTVPQPASRRALGKPLFVPEPWCHHLENGWISKEEMLWKILQPIILFSRGGGWGLSQGGQPDSVLLGKSCQVPGLLTPSCSSCLEARAPVSESGHQSLCP